MFIGKVLKTGISIVQKDNEKKFYNNCHFVTQQGGNPPFIQRTHDDHRVEGYFKKKLTFSLPLDVIYK